MLRVDVANGPLTRYTAATIALAQPRGGFPVKA